MSVGQQRLRAARAGGIAGIAATALLMTAPGALADHTTDHPGKKSAGKKYAGKGPVGGAAEGEESDSEKGSGKAAEPDADKSDAARPDESDGAKPDESDGAKRGEADGGGARPGRPEPGEAGPGVPEAKGRLDAHLVRGTGKVRTGATLNYRLDLDVRGTVRAVTVDLETNLGTWLTADVAPTRGAGRGAGRVATAAGAGLRCAVDGGERVRCSAGELTGASQVKQKLRMPDRTEAAELKIAGQVTAGGEVDALTDTATVTRTADKNDHKGDGYGDGHQGDNDGHSADGDGNGGGGHKDDESHDGDAAGDKGGEGHDADGAGHKGGEGHNGASGGAGDGGGHSGRGDGHMGGQGDGQGGRGEGTKAAGETGGAAHGGRPGGSLLEVPRPMFPPIRTVNVASLPLDDSPPRLPEVGPVGMPGVAPQRPAPETHRPRTATEPAAQSTTRSADEELPDGAAIALGLGGLAIMLAGGLYGRAALRKN